MIAAAAPAADPGLTARIDGLPALLADSSRYDIAFTARFRADVPKPQWRALLAQLDTNAGRPLTVERVIVRSPLAASVRVRFERALVGMDLTVDPTPPHAIAGLRIHAPVATDGSPQAVLAAIRALPGFTAVAISRLGDTGPVPLFAHDADRELSIGSEFKLVILAEIVRAIAAGERNWDDPIAIPDAPFPGGGYSTRPAGTTVALRELASRMIAVSDNSATDILIATLGRDAIEAMLPRLGIARPAGMRPFLTTLEAFRLKAMIASGDTRWLTAADEAARRGLLAGPVAAFPLAEVDKAFTGRPLSIDAVEWRATPADMIRTLDWIRRHTQAGPAAEARAILAANPGVAPEATAGWRYIGYKGGSEPGVIAMSLLLQHPDGDWTALSAGWNDPADPLDEARFIALVSRLAELLAKTGR